MPTLQSGVQRIAMSCAESAAADAAVIVDDPADAPAAAHATGRGKGKPKAKPKPKPRIDIDDQIAEANRLAQVMKKLTQAAKTMQKNGCRVKQRLVKKAGKLSASDLERITVLKRCGLFTGDIGAHVPDATECDAANKSAQARAMINSKMKDVMCKIPGAHGLFKRADSPDGFAFLGDGQSSTASSSRSSCGRLGGVMIAASRLPDQPRKDKLDALAARTGMEHRSQVADTMEHHDAHAEEEDDNAE